MAETRNQVHFRQRRQLAQRTNAPYREGFGVVLRYFEQRDLKVGESLCFLAFLDYGDAARCFGQYARRMEVGADCNGSAKACGLQRIAQPLGERSGRSKQPLRAGNVQHECTRGSLARLFYSRRKAGRAFQQHRARRCLTLE